MQQGKRQTADKGAWLSIVAYLVLTIFKLAAGYLLNSKALTADGFNNSTDILASAAVLIGLKISKKPPDENHPYGHSRSETIASLLASFIMVTIGLEVLIRAVQAVFTPNQIIPDLTAAWIALISAFIMVFVYLYNKSLAKKTNSHALMAAAKDNLSDALVSIGAFTGIVGSQFNLPWLDPLAAFLVGLMILKTAWGIFLESTHMLSDGFSPEKLQPFKKTIKSVAGVNKIKQIKARIYGNEVFVDAIIEVNPLLNVIESHEITKNIEEKMRNEHNIIDMHIHIEPDLG